MSDMNTTMKFELLPNEIIIECLQYLNGPDIFYSFDQLNYRFSTLIRNISLHFDYQQLKRVTYNFTRNTTRINCAKLTSLCLGNARRLPKYAKDYFPHV